VEIHPKFIKPRERPKSELKKGSLSSSLSALFKQELRDRGENVDEACHWRQ
jgi:hypothetical protein